MHQKALAEIELQQAKLREMIASKRAEKETLQAVYERLKKRGDDGKS
jgi:cell division FtsZ-interacting protein ZapD